MELQKHMAHDASSSPSLPPLDPGTLVKARYRVEALLGQGSLGSVYSVIDQQSARPAALRMLPPDLGQSVELMQRVEQDQRAASSLKHKNLALGYDFFQDNGFYYVVQELVEGQSLRQLLERKREAQKPFTLKGAYNVAAHLCNGLEQAHAQGLVHGLPAPGSVLVNQSGRVKLADLGLLPLLAARAMNGTPLSDDACLAPELRQGAPAVDARADIYTVGATLHVLLTFEPPRGLPVQTSAFFEGIPPAVDAVITRCLQPDPTKRYETMAQLKAAFFEAIGGKDQALTSSDSLQMPAELSPPAPPAAAMASPRASGPSPAPPPPPLVGPSPAAAPAPAPAFGPAPGPTSPFQIAAPIAPVQAPGYYPAPIPGVPGALPGPMMGPAGQAPRPGKTIEDYLAESDPNDFERWLVQKDRLDFGPFTMADLKRQIYEGQFGGDDMVKDQETGQSARLRTLPNLREFLILVDRHRASTLQQKEEMQRWEKEKKRRTMTIVVVAISLLVLGAGGAVAAYLMTRDPETRERIVYRDKTDEALLKLLNKLEITFKTQEPENPESKAKRVKRRVRKSGAPAGAEGEEVTYLGDANEEGGDARLTPNQVQQVMQANYKHLIPCVMGELKRNGGLKRVDIDFGIRGTGFVENAKVNGQTSGPFHACILAKMKTFKFPSFAGSLTPASFFLSLGH